MITLRAATPDDVPLLEAWDAEPHVVFASGDDGAMDWLDELADETPGHEVLVAELDGRPIGVIQIIDPELEPTHYWGDVEADLRAIDIWIGPADDLGQGYGTVMMQLALDRCFAPPEVTGVLIDPLAKNTRAIAFYRRLGFVEVGERVFGPDVCLVHRFDRSSWAGPSA